MEGYHLGVVHLIDMVAGEDQHIVGIISVNERDILCDGISRALIPVGILALLIGREHMHAAVHAVQIPGLAGADVLVELQGLVLGKHAYSLNAGIDAVGEGEVYNAVLSPEGHSGLGDVLCKHTQPAALAARKQHGYDLLFG